MSALDVQVGGGHYKDYVIQPIEFAMLNHLDTCQHAILKYVCRFKEKGGQQDLQKARHYLDLLEEFHYGGKKEAQPVRSAAAKSPLPETYATQEARATADYGTIL